MGSALKGRVAIVTGAGQGLGRAIAEEYATQGAAVVVADVVEERAGTTVAAISDAGGRALAVRADVSSAASVATLVEHTVAELGAIDIVCNNAGILDDFAPLGDTTDDLWDRVLDVNLTGQFLVSRAALAHMLAAGRGVFVNISSMAGTVAGAGGAAYTASKHGVIGLTRHLSAEYGRRGIRANAVCPGSMDTEMSRRLLADAPDVLEIVNSVPAGRQGRPQEVATVAAYLASDDSSFMHGATVMIDGGWTIR